MSKQKVIPFTDEELANETWKEISQLDKIYQVSNLGRVKSLERRVPTLRGTRRVRERILKINSFKHGYPLINVTINNKSRHLLLYKAVINSFNPKKDKYLVCRHLDGNKLNNRLSNLCWGTHKENSIDTIIHEQGTAKLSFKDVIEIRFLYDNNYLNINQLKNIFNICSSSITDVCNRKSFYFMEDKILSLQEIRKDTIDRIKNLINKNLYRGISFRKERNAYSVCLGIGDGVLRKYCRTFEEALETRNYFMKKLYGNLSYFYIFYSEDF